MRTISTYLLSSLFALFLLCPPSIQAQVKKKESTKEESAEPKYPLFQGLTLGVDLFGAGSYLLGDDFLSTEVALTANLGYKFYPVVEIGFGKTDTNNDKGIHYKTAAPYFRLGVDYNVTAKKRSDSHFYVGARYGFSTFSYDVTAPTLKDGIWGGEVPFNYQGEKSSAHWAEIVVGVQAEIVKNFLMGWSLRYRSPLSVKENQHTRPWYIPGLGENKSTTITATYSLIYKLPF